MSQLLINQYLNNLGKLKQVCGVARESVIREACKDLLKAWGRSLNLIFIPSMNISPQEPEYVAHIITADVKTGRRRVISYLLSPFAHQIEEAGRER